MKRTHGRLALPVAFVFFVGIGWAPAQQAEKRADLVGPPAAPGPSVPIGITATLINTEFQCNAGLGPYVAVESGAGSPESWSYFLGYCSPGNTVTVLGYRLNNGMDPAGIVCSGDQTGGESSEWNAFSCPGGVMRLARQDDDVGPFCAGGSFEDPQLTFACPAQGVFTLGLFDVGSTGATPTFEVHATGVQSTAPTTTGYYVLDRYGGVHAGGAAPAFGPPGTPYFGFDVTQDLEVALVGYYVLDRFGGVHAGGGAPVLSPATPYWGFDVAQSMRLTPTANGYYVLDRFGGVHTGGAASPIAPGTPYFGFPAAQDLELCC